MKNLKTVCLVMHKLARAYKPQELAHDAYPLYDVFRPAHPGGHEGQGGQGALDLGLLEKLAKRNE